MSISIILASGMALAATIVGDNNANTITGTADPDTLLGYGGDDTITGLGGTDTVSGGDGDDNLYGGNESMAAGFDDNVTGGAGNDSLTGGPGADDLVGGPGNDIILEGPINDAAADSVSGGAGNDSIKVASSPASKDSVACGDGVDEVEADSLDAVSPDCENVERMTITAAQATDPPPGSDGIQLLAGPVYYECKIPAYGNYKCGPAFDMPKGWRLYVNQRGSSPYATTTSYAAFNYTSSGCNGAQLTGWRYAQNGDTVYLGRIGLDYGNICVKANVRAARERTIWGYYLRYS